MEIKTLKDMRIALSEIPDDVLDKFGLGVDPEDQGDVVLMYYSDVDDDSIALYNELIVKYPELQVIDNWVRAIIKEQEKAEQQLEEVYERTEPISSKEGELNSSEKVKTEANK